MMQEDDFWCIQEKMYGTYHIKGLIADENQTVMNQ
jgi:hypothetical protein